MPLTNLQWDSYFIFRDSFPRSYKFATIFKTVTCLVVGLGLPSTDVGSIGPDRRSMPSILRKSSPPIQLWLSTIGRGGPLPAPRARGGARPNQPMALQL